MGYNVYQNVYFGIEVKPVPLLISPERMLETEKQYFAESGIPSIEFMERAASALSDAALARFPEAETIFIACGPGGNGGDGYACARMLKEAGKNCTIYASAPAKSPDAVENARRAAEAGIPVYTEELPEAAPDLWIDCLYGTGLSRAPEGSGAELIRRMNSDHQLGAGLIACDIPSGLNGRTGAAYAPCVQADVTVSFQLAKFGHVLQDGLDMCGELIIADIGFPRGIFEPWAASPESAFLIRDTGIKLACPPRKRNIHKGNCGHLLIVAGSFGMAGAAALCTKAALRSGVGLITIACPEPIIPILQTLAPQAMCVSLSEENLRRALNGKTAIAVGPGLTRSFPPELLKLILESGIPAVIDADALNVLSENPQLKALLKPHHILTPHPGEAARLLGRKCGDPVADARELASCGATAVLKGASRVIANASRRFIHTSGASGMARGGSGDVLTGILGALLAAYSAKSSDVDALAIFIAAAACELHGLAGELAQEKYGSYAMNSADIIEFLPEVFKRYAN